MRGRSCGVTCQKCINVSNVFLATLTGPGHVVLQSMPILNLAEEIGRYLPRGGEK